jgi:hypothetical protein
MKKVGKLLADDSDLSSDLVNVLSQLAPQLLCSFIPSLLLTFKHYRFLFGLLGNRFSIDGAELGCTHLVILPDAATEDK